MSPMAKAMVKKSTKGMPARKRRAIRLSDSIAGLTRGLLARQGFAQTDVVTQWSSIVGKLLAAHCLPERLSFPSGERRGGTLHVIADSAFALELQHLTPEVIQRINSYYGFEAVSRLRITQAPVAKRRAMRRKKPAPLSPDDEKTLSAAVAPAHDDKLREALKSLGAAIFSAPETE